METRLQVLLERSVVGVVRKTAVLLAVIITSLLGVGVGSAVADPSSTVETQGGVLCSGYMACSTDGFTTNGYQANEKASWWRMYPGNNCTNYVAYVESKIFGVSDPTYLLGDAFQWASTAHANGVPIDHTPAVGAVAFWGSKSPGIGYYGHVAIVQDVGPDGSYIDVSQSGMGSADDGYNWERIYASTNSWEPWPDSFIHFPGTDIPTPQAPPPAPSWPQVMLSQLSWAPQASDGASSLLQLPQLA